MSTVTDFTTSTSVSTSADRLRHSFSAMRVAFTWLGMRKTLNADQRLQAASQFGAEQKFISAGKKLIDTGHPAMKAVNQLKRQITDYWKSQSLPYPESGTRLVRQSELEQLNSQMIAYQQQLEVAVLELEASYEEIKDQARERLGDLYSEGDYPASLAGLFEVTWDFPNVEPPTYLQRLQPELYEQECQRIRGRFDDAVQMAEQAFAEELASLVSHLGERLAGNEDGKPKVFRDSAVENLTEFFERFRRLNISSSQELDELVERAQGVITGVRPQALRTDATLRQDVATQLSGVQSVLDGMMVDRPRDAFCGDDHMELYIMPDGQCQAIYSETLELRSLGRTNIRRASHVEPTDEGHWTADLAPVGGPVLGPFPSRTQALDAELTWLTEWLRNGRHSR